MSLVFMTFYFHFARGMYFRGAMHIIVCDKWNPFTSHLSIYKFHRIFENYLSVAGIFIFRWFKFTLKPPNSMVHGNFFSAIWETSHRNFFVKFGLKTPYDIS